MGRPTKFLSSYCKQVEKLCKLGATDKELANFFEVSESTLNLWKKEYPVFSESIKRGKIVADANVADSLYKRALGYKHKAVKFLICNKVIEEVKYTEHYPPDTAAAIFWLKNRSKTNWSDKVETDITSAGKPINAILGGDSKNVPEDNSDTKIT